MTTFAKFARQLRQKYQVNPILPFGTPIEHGLIGTLDGGAFHRIGSCQEILGVPVPALVSATQPAQWAFTSGRDVSVNLLAAADTSPLFPQYSGSVRVQLDLGQSESFVFSARGVTVTTLASPAALFPAIMAAYARGDWKDDYILINEVAATESAFIALSESAGGSLLLTAKGNLSLATVDVGAIAGNFQIAAKTREVETYESGGPLFLNALRVRTSWFKGTTVQPFADRPMETGEIFVPVVPSFSAVEAAR